MLTKGDKIRVNDGPDYRDEEGVISDVDFSDTFPYVVTFPDGTWDVFNPDKLTPLPKEPCPMCGSRDEHHSTTTCEEDRHAGR